MKQFDKKSLTYGLGGFLVGALIMVPTITSAHPDESGIKGAIGDIKAEVLGFDSASDLKNSDKSKKEIAKAAGFSSREDVHAAVAEAVAGSDKLTDEQKAEFEKRSVEREANREAFQTEAAKLLGISVEALEQAHEDGKKIDDLLEEAGKTHEEFKTAMEEAGVKPPHHRGGHGPGGDKGGERG